MAGLGDRSLFFLHIPKTAGTSFRDLLGRRIAPESILSIGRDDTNSVLDKLSTVDRYRFVHGRADPETPDSCILGLAVHRIELLGVG